MSRPGFLGDNEARAYPLVPGGPDLRLGGLAVRLPYAAVVDFGCVVGLDAGYDDRVHSVRLAAVARAGDSFTFEFRCDAPGLAGLALRFVRTPADPEFSTDAAEAAEADGDCVAVRDDPLWEGWLTTGLLDGLAAALPDGQTLAAGAGAPAVEPALVQNLARGFVRTLNLANEDRTRVTGPADCPAESSASLGDPVAADREYRTIVNRECLYGPQVVREGYNCVVRQNARDNSLTISAALAAGRGEPCAEVKLADRETPPPGSSLLTGGPACAELVTSINGLTGSVITLVPLQGVRVAPSATRPNTLVVDVDLHDMALCPPTERSSETLPPGAP